MKRRRATRGNERSQISTGKDRRAQLLAAAREAFAERGYEGARIDDIATRAGANKQLLYHYFGGKELLYAAVLEEIYGSIRSGEQALDLTRMRPLAAMRALVEFSFDYLAGHPEFVAIIADANAHRAHHLAASRRLAEMNRPIIDLVRQTLKRGVADSTFRTGVDALQLYLSIAGLSFFFFANRHTLSRVFNRSLSDGSAVARRRKHVVDFVLRAIVRSTSSEGQA